MVPTDQVPCLLGRFCKMEQREIVGTDEPFFSQHRPIDEPLPIGLPDQYYRNVASFAGLEKGEGFKELVEGAESAWKDDQRSCTKEKMHFP